MSRTVDQAKLTPIARKIYHILHRARFTDQEHVQVGRIVVEAFRRNVSEEQWAAARKTIGSQLEPTAWVATNDPFDGFHSTLSDVVDSFLSADRRTVIEVDGYALVTRRFLVIVPSEDGDGFEEFNIYEDALKRLGEVLGAAQPPAPTLDDGIPF